MIKSWLPHPTAQVVMLRKRLFSRYLASDLVKERDSGITPFTIQGSLESLINCNGYRDIYIFRIFKNPLDGDFRMRLGSARMGEFFARFLILTNVIQGPSGPADIAGWAYLVDAQHKGTSMLPLCWSASWNSISIIYDGDDSSHIASL